MAISDTQKIDYLWKKVGFAEAKTETANNKIAGSGNETIPSALQIRGDKVMTDADRILLEDQSKEKIKKSKSKKIKSKKK